MIALLLAVALFALAPTPDSITSTFALNGFTTDAQGIRTVTTTAPTLGVSDDGFTLDFSFISPVKGSCIAGDVVTIDSKPKMVPLDQSDVNKGATLIVSIPLPNEADIVAAGGAADGYTVFIVCDADSDTDGTNPVFSNFYHIDAPATKPAQERTNARTTNI